MRGAVADAKAIAAALGGEARGNRVAVPSPGHSKGDRGTVLTVDPRAPDSLLVHSFNGADPLTIKDDLRSRGLLPERPLMGQRAFKRTAPSGASTWLQTGSYDYDNGAGQVIYRTRRLEADGKKRLVAERFDNGRWISGLDGVDRLPYRFTELCKPDDPVHAGPQRRLRPPPAECRDDGHPVVARTFRMPPSATHRNSSPARGPGSL